MPCHFIKVILGQGIIRRVGMPNTRNHFSQKRASNGYQRPISLYFPFGEQREKLKSYVFDQLHGEEAIKNAEILNKFREEAAVRRRRQLRRLSYTEQPEHMLREAPPKQEIFTQFSPPAHESNIYRFANYYPRQFQRYSLIPTQKTPPPIIKLASLDTYKMRDTSRAKTKVHHNPETALELGETVKGKKKFTKIRHQHRRSESLDIDARPYKEKALEKIKEIAKQRKIGTTKQEEKYSADSSQILQQLQYKKQVSKVQYKHLNKQMKKLKKYREYLKNAQRYHF